MKSDIQGIRGRVESGSTLRRIDFKTLLTYITELETELEAAKMDMGVACIFGEACAVCANCRNRGDQFPCAISDKWCCGQGWEWRGPVKGD